VIWGQGANEVVTVDAAIVVHVSPIAILRQSHKRRNGKSRW